MKSIKNFCAEWYDTTKFVAFWIIPVIIVMSALGLSSNPLNAEQYKTTGFVILYYVSSGFIITLLFRIVSFIVHRWWAWRERRYQKKWDADRTEYP